MPTAPVPLDAGIVLAGRFELIRVLGRGGFGTAYLATDRTRGDDVVVKELAPEGSERGPDGQLNLDSLGPGAAQRLRRCFLDEAKLLARLNIPGVVNVRTYGIEDGSAYYVTDFFADAEPLDEVMRRTGRMAIDGALDIGFQIMETIEGVHRRGILHRDIKPANVLLCKNGQTLLIDFGAAREWHADMTEHHTVLFTPGYAPLEQLSERAKRGPATDIYGLAALIYTLLAGFPPAGATDRLNGSPLTPLAQVRPEIEPQIARAIEAGLALYYADRPQTISEFRELFKEQESPSPEVSALDSIDLQLLALQKLSFGRRQCPGCGEVLVVAAPLARGRCPVCNRGAIKPRPIHAAVCPACHLGILRTTPNENPLAICPLCDKGLLERRRAKLLSKDFTYKCENCEAQFSEHEGSVTLTQPGSRTDLEGKTDTWEGWRTQTQRAHEVHVCDGCHAQYDLLPDGQWLQMDPAPTIGSPSRLYPEEWARVAAGLDPGCGTHVCTACEADYFVDGERVTLLDAHEDPFHFADANMGRPLTWEALRWLGAGKSSERPGPSCPNCGTEFDAEGDYLRLIRTENRRLSKCIDALQTFEDWHRMARGLPRVDEQAAFEASLDDAILAAYLDGSLTFDEKGTLWKGAATRESDGAVGELLISPTEITFGRLLRRDKTPLELLVSARAAGDSLALHFRGSSEAVAYEVAETELVVHLESGGRVAQLDAGDLAHRLDALIQHGQQVGRMGHIGPI